MIIFRQDLNYHQKIRNEDFKDCNSDYGPYKAIPILFSFFIRSTPLTIEYDTLTAKTIGQTRKYPGIYI